MKTSRIQTSKLVLLNGYYKNPSEELVDLWLQTKGFVTMHNAYYWAQTTKQAAWRDIDVLGISKDHLAIVQVTTNLETKSAENALHYFSIAKRFISANPYYKWIAPRRKKWLIVACINPPRERILMRFHQESKRKHLEVISFEKILTEINKYLESVIKGSKIDGRIDNAVLHFYRNVKKYPDLLQPIG